MTEWKEVRLRKPRECGWCGKMMNAGDPSAYCEGRRSAETESELSKGNVVYYKVWVHPFNVVCQLPEPQRSECLSGNHSWVEEYESDGYVGCNRVGHPTGIFYCEHCGAHKTDASNE